MRESRLYLNFFKSNWLVILVPTLMGFLVGGYFLITTPNEYKIRQALKVINPKGSLVDSSLIAGQVVSNLRVMREVSQFDVYQSGPDIVIYEVSGSNQLEEISKGIGDDAEKNFAVKRLGNSFKSSVSWPLLSFLFPVLLGFLTGVLISLVKTYFKKY